MSLSRDLFAGLVTAVVSILILGGSITLAMGENQASLAQLAAPTPFPSRTPTATISPTPLPTTRPNEPTYTPSITPSITNTPLPTQTMSPTEESVSCSYPDGWTKITINTGDTLESIAATYKTTTSALSEANCLLVETLRPGGTIYVPPLPPTQTLIPCGPPAGWVYYIVKSGDTLFNLGQAYGIHYSVLQQANCLGSSTYIQAGQSLFVPYVLVNTVTPSSTATMTATSSATSTTIPSATITNTAPSASFTPTSTASPTSIVAPTDTQTPIATQTNTSPPPTETPTLVPTATATSVPTETATSAPVPSATATP